jgi:hydrogenase maturation protease
MNERLVVLGIGNTILRDEGLGVKALELLRERYEFSPPVELIDGGTIGIDLLYFLEGVDKLLVLDAVSGGKPPGSLYLFRNEEVKKYFRHKVSMHEIGFQEVLSLLDIKGKPINCMTVMGIEPKLIELGTELSPEVEDRLEDLVNMAVEELRGWGVKVFEKVKEEV